jgi:hypothetical protein
MRKKLGEAFKVLGGRHIHRGASFLFVFKNRLKYVNIKLDFSFSEI